MKLAHYIRVRVLSNSEEDIKIVESNLRDFFPFNIEDEKLKLNINTVKGVKDNKITIMEIELKKDSHTTKFLKNLTSKLDIEQKKIIIGQLDSRIDEGNHIYIRLDKEKLLNNEFKITDEGNCFHIVICLACFPSTLKNAKKLATEIFK